MQRFIRLSIFVAMLGLLGFGTATAQPQVKVSGVIESNDVRIFVKDSTYVLDKELKVKGMLIIEPGTTLQFLPNGRLVVYPSGLLVADGNAEAVYNQFPDGYNPMSNSPAQNPFNWVQYTDLNYFTYDGTQSTIDVNTDRDLTVSPDKYNYLFNVILDKSDRRIWNITPGQLPNPGLSQDQVVIPFEKAIAFVASRMNLDPGTDPNLSIRPYARIGGSTVGFPQATITFRGQPVNNASVEWGHVVVLPGARGAFFRNVRFENFKKDTTVDRIAFLESDISGQNLSAMNQTLTTLTNGSGGAITSFASRTWLLDVTFANNMARFKGGALQLLETPKGWNTPYSTVASLINDRGQYPSDKNPAVTDKDGTPSSIIEDKPVPRIDNIDEDQAFGEMSDALRMTVDDARLAVYLGRVRNLTFDNNKVQLANTVNKLIGNVLVHMDDLDNPAKFPLKYGNNAFGGAIYIGGQEGSENRKIEVGLGVNNGIMTANGLQEFPEPDEFVAVGNRALNYQSSGSSEGSRGGAIHAGPYTSLILAGEFNSNETFSKFHEDEILGSNASLYSMGGAVYMDNTLSRLQLRGGPQRETIGNQTVFSNNKSGAGGAVYVDGNSDPQMSPIVGGSDATLNTRDYGFGIVFENNIAVTYGGAIFSKRNGSINGSGGIEGGQLIGYGGDWPVRFANNSAGYAGGAVNFSIPNGIPLPSFQRNIHIRRTVFDGNTVGLNISESNMPEIRGGGAVYSLNADLNVVAGVNVTNNTVYNGNGAGFALVHPLSSSLRLFVSDLDEINYDGNGVARSYSSFNDPFIWADGLSYPADVRMLTRFTANKIVLDQEYLDAQSGTGATQYTAGTFRTRDQLMSTYWTTNTTGYAVGQNGTIVKFDNNGEDWYYQNSGTTYRLNRVIFTNNTTGYAVGDLGVFVKTTDGGVTWNKINLGTFTRLNDIYFVGQNQAYIAGDGGYVYSTQNAWNTWSVSQVATFDLNGVYFSGTNNGWVVGDSKTIMRTTDGGLTWITQVPPIPNPYNLFKVRFVSTNKGFITGAGGTLLMTSDAGASWQKQDVGVNVDINDGYFINQAIGYLITKTGEIIKTGDGGISWTADESTTNFGLWGINFSSNTVGTIVGDWGLVLRTSNGGNTWTSIDPVGAGINDVVRIHPATSLPENGVGLGGAIYILDSLTTNRIGRTDSVKFNRVRLQDNEAYTGAAIYSDNFDMKLIFSRSLITGNTATSQIGVEQNYIAGPLVTGTQTANEASSDLASAVLYGEVQGPLPAYTSPEAGNSIYDNNARFIIRLPDAPNTKSYMSGTGSGFSGTDTLRGNYWGNTEANVNLQVENLFGLPGVIFETFFIGGNGTSPVPFIYAADPSTLADARQQGPFESIARYNYRPIPLNNDAADENIPGANSIEEKLLMSGRIYDLYDKGVDIKNADYSKRRMSPVEDFAVGIPPVLRRFDDEEAPSYGKYIRRLTRDPHCVEMVDDQGNLMFPFMADLQTEWRANEGGEFYHPIGYPLYLEAHIDYDGLAERSNHDPLTLNETVFFVINETTGDYVRSNLKQVSEVAPNREAFRSRVEFIPDSTNRLPNSLYRRTTEGLFNFGSGFSLLQKLEDNPYNEDGAALPGRKYHNTYTQFGNAENLFSNRPLANLATEPVTFFGGERYDALPVNVGDEIRVISRTVLWREGIVEAFDDGISFKIERSTMPPTWTGNIVSLQQDTIVKIMPSQYPDRNAQGIPDTVYMTEFLNKIFVTEDRTYPVEPGVYSDPFGDGIDVVGYDEAMAGAGRDSILTATAIDSNNFYDPRSYTDPTEYSRLTYSWSVPGNSGLRHWLQVDTIFAQDDEFQMPRDSAYGYLMFRGRPTNAFVVPGGEKVTVTAANYPPHFRLLDSLRGAGWDQEAIDCIVETFPSYFNAQSYDTQLSRYLQQDTINFGINFERMYQFDLFVVDSIPVIFDNTLTPETIYRLDKRGDEVGTIVAYEPSIYKCGLTEDGEVIANVTDKLRFQLDINSDDELEDKWAETNFNWDFRYGRSSYGFVNIANSAGDTVVVDSITVKDEFGNDITLVDQVRPNWMNDDNLHRFDTDANVDQFGQDFFTNGQLNVRIDRTAALDLLRPINQVNGAYNTDTSFVVVLNDGHGGKSYKKYNLFVNISPTITTTQLPNATEGTDYNPQLLDSGRAIKVYDPNFNQTLSYRLIYEGEGDIAKDPCYEEAGNWVEGTDYGINDQYTPEWLKINSESGLLYGKPGIKDAPKQVPVIVLVEDENGLRDLRIFQLTVDPIQHDPWATAIPEAQCIDENTGYSDKILVIDRDLLRDESTGFIETLTFTVTPAGLTLTPSTVTGPAASDTVIINITSTPAFFDNLVRDNDGRVRITITVTDASGASYELTYRVKVSDPTYFTAPIKITNSVGAFQILQFGTAAQPASTGDASDGFELGKLDSNYCEFEIPSFPPADVFDARWTIPTINGTLRSIYPGDVVTSALWVGSVQSGGEANNTSINFPITMEWNLSDVPAPEIDPDRNPLGSGYYLWDATSHGDLFNIRMHNGDSKVTQGYTFEVNGDLAKLTINQSDFNAFVIFRDAEGSAGEGDISLTNSITNVSPNPISENTTISYEIALRSDVTMEVIDVVGNVVARLVDAKNVMPGQYSLTWNGEAANGAKLAQGSYTLRMLAGDKAATQTITVIR